MNPQNAYTQWSVTYDTDRNLTRDLDQTLTQNFLAGQHFQSILEIGCGTGKNTALLAGLAQRVLALDFSEGMILQAQQKINAPTVTYALADLTQPWPCPAQSADFINCNLVLEHIPNLDPIFAEVQRTLRPGGRFLSCELHPFRQYLGTLANFKRGEEVVFIQSYIHHISDFTEAAQAHGLTLLHFKEWWHPDDQNKPPRLVTFMFEKP
jgi:ubiquinone/menaquinone biosynthesis C-methylase UbiE